MAKEYIVGGKSIKMFTIGEVAKELGRSHLTVRKWERDGVLPPAEYRSESNRRLYTEAQVEAIKRMVEKHNVRKGVKIPEQFIYDVHDAFRDADKERR